MNHSYLKSLSDNLNIWIRFFDCLCLDTVCFPLIFVRPIIFPFQAYDLKFFNITFQNYFPLTVITKWNNCIPFTVISKYYQTYILHVEQYLPEPTVYSIVYLSTPLPPVPSHPNHQFVLYESALFMLFSLVCCTCQTSHISGIIQCLSFSDVYPIIFIRCWTLCVEKQLRLEQIVFMSIGQQIWRVNQSSQEVGWVYHRISVQ